MATGSSAGCDVPLLLQLAIARRREKSIVGFIGLRFLRLCGFTVMRFYGCAVLRLCGFTVMRFYGCAVIVRVRVRVKVRVKVAIADIADIEMIEYS